MTHICVSKLIITDSDTGLSPGRSQAIIWANDGILLIGPSETNLSEISSEISEIEIHTFSFNKMHMKMSSGKWRRFCLGLNALTRGSLIKMVDILQGAVSRAFSWRIILVFWLHFLWGVPLNCQLEADGPTSEKCSGWFRFKCQTFSFKKMYVKYRLPSGGHSVLASLF